jgi:predicted nucleic acid-binding protein
LERERSGLKIVIDANIIVALALPLPYSDAATEKIREWQEQEVELVVPTLWHYEYVSTLRKALVLNMISSEEVSEALQNIFSLGIQDFHPTIHLHQKAMQWASRLNQTVAYDAAYLALAEHLNSDFWTADTKLFKTAENEGLSWVRLIR